MAVHQHAKAGGGTEQHDHAFTPSAKHGHDGLRPLPVDAGKKALGMSVGRQADGSYGIRVDGVDPLQISPGFVDGPPQRFAELSSAARGNLTSSQFAWTDSDGQGHLPLNDASHVRNAAARFNQTQFPDAATKRKAAAKIKAAAKRLGVDLGSDSPVMQMAEGGALIAVAGSSVDLSERTVPYLTTGHWEFPDYGTVDVDPAKLLSVVQHFRDNVRGQDLPLCDVDHVDPIYRGLAVGWVKDLVPDDAANPTRIDAVVELNEEGDGLIAQDRVRYVSPTLMRDWTDPATGVMYPLVAAGVDVRTRSADGADGSALAFTNMPRLKQLGRIACAEDGSPRAAVLAMGETAGTSPARAARLLMQEFGDDDGPVPPCMYQPGQPATPSCPGFTRWPGDDDGDGTCLLATRDCNGYRAVQSDEYQPPWQFNEGIRMPDDGAGADPAPTTQPAQPQPDPAQPEQAPQPANPQTPQQPAPQPVQPTPPAQGQADDREAQVIRAAETRALESRFRASETAREAAETRLAAVEKQLRDMHMAEKLGRIGDRLSMALRQGKIDHAEFERLTAPDNLVKFAENDTLAFVLEAIEARPASSAIPMGEIGSGGVPTQNGQEAGKRLTAKAQEIMAAAAQRGGRPMAFSEAMKQAARELPDAASTVARA